MSDDNKKDGIKHLPRFALKLEVLIGFEKEEDAIELAKRMEAWAKSKQNEGILAVAACDLRERADLAEAQAAAARN